MLDSSQKYSQRRYPRLIQAAVSAWRFVLFGKSCTPRAGARSMARRRRRYRRLTLPDRLIRQTTPTRGRCDETRETDLQRANEGGQRGLRSIWLLWPRNLSMGHTGRDAPLWPRRLSYGALRQERRN